MKLVLVCNYAPDRQQSMLRFGALLEQQWAKRGSIATVLAPRSSMLSRTLARRGEGAAAKWLGYFDKYLVFPSRLKRELRRLAPASDGEHRLLIHVVDHSNALYLPAVADLRTRWVVTCHDLLAVRGALGEDTDCPASALGRRLQRAIVGGLGRADAIAADSTSTLRDVERLVPVKRIQRRRVILLGLSHPYMRIAAMEARARLAAVEGVPWAEPFVLHVGSNLARKNKAGVLRVFTRLAAEWRGNLVFCGAPLSEEIRAQAAAAGLTDRVFAVPAPDNAQLEAIYTLAHALLFPSRCEGFGWPVIEAQVCGCPVVCSDRTSLPEIGGPAALVHALDDESGMAASLQRLAELAFRRSIVAAGKANLARFTTERMVDEYGALYEEVLAARPR